MSRPTLARRALRRGLVALLLAAAVTWAPLHSWDDEARVIDRPAPDRPWVHKGKTPWGLSLDLTRARRSSGSTRVDTPGRAATPFACERIWILDRARTRLGQTVGLRLQDALLGVPGLTEAAYFPRADQPLAILRPPDLFVVLEVAQLAEHFLPGAGHVTATIVATVSRTALPSLVVDDLEPGPRLRFELDVTERAWGLRSSAARYSGIADEFVAQLDLGAWVADQRAKSPGAAAPPLALVARADAGVAGLAWPVPESARLYSQSTLGTRDQTVWLQETADRDEARRRLEEAGRALVSAGWEVGGGPDVLEARRVGPTENGALTLHTRGKEDVPGLVVRRFDWAAPAVTVERLASFLRGGGDVAGARDGVALLPGHRREALRDAARAAGLARELSAVLGGE